MQTNRAVIDDLRANLCQTDICARHHLSLGQLKRHLAEIALSDPSILVKWSPKVLSLSLATLPKEFVALFSPEKRAKADTLKVCFELDETRTGGIFSIESAESARVIN